ncbi:hypothetical protein TrVE_jg3407 [Triparma verrucosa]|uniref:PNPLA domain-containing protein n=2 Tax=Triparma TaxID=722752 RepID=A0A9W7AW25_9STRA|nr:hypothetical protein TrST_g8164 [Triparma strigata]GMI03061.1 hypothetical protein TrVE_jg3407 [Triparma verrucosa]
MSTPKTLAIPGGGIYFYHLYGQLDYLREAGYTDGNPDLRLVGASAGSLAATLFTYGVSSEVATNCAIRLSDEADLWNNPLGLAFVWGQIIEEWLEELIPSGDFYSDPDSLCLLLSETSFSSLTGNSERRKVSKFRGREDLINANMCSVHIPIFLDKRLTRDFRGERFIDGSFRSRLTDYKFMPEDPLEGVVMLDYDGDERLKEKGGEGADTFVSLISKDYVWKMIELGYTHARRRDGEGKFKGLMK